MIAVALALMPGSSAVAQSPARTVPGASAGEALTFASRQELQTHVDSLSDVLSRTDDSQTAAMIREEIDRTRRRLEQGDFQPGDVIQLTVRGDSTLTGKFPVRSGPELELPTVANVDLSNVLFAEADSVIRASLSEYLRRPEVEVRVLRRVAVTGGVTNPGFYDFPPSATLSEVIMAAGGPTQNAKLTKMEFRRDGKDLLDQEPPDVRAELTLS
ncbi:MAG TPA: SLBB domain-containing protein, partial [Gemmatimonadota bacterium]|nr:SLBB domain-containing protein [Gemmatimonadota bacterium]